MLKKKFFLSLISVFITMLVFQAATAADSDWAAKQKKLFQQIGLNPGDVINTSNWQKVQNLLPESVVGYVKKGEFVLKIGEMKYDYSMDAAWDKASAANKGKYGLGKNKEVIDTATGKYPMYIYGRPFPVIDWRNDPDAGIKIMHNKTVDEARAGDMEQWATTLFMSDNKGLDRKLLNHVWYSWFWARPNGEINNPDHFKWVEIVALTTPYDLAGTTILTQRPLDGSADRSGTYVPALRRVRKSSGVNRSDPFFGSDFVNDDGGGWGGQNETMSWKVIGEKVVLMCKIDWQADSPDILVKQPNGSWLSQKGKPCAKYGHEDKSWNGAKWAPLNVIYVPREMYIIEATPLDPYYNYGKQIFYVDKEAQVPVYKITANKAGEHWKTLFIDQYTQNWGDDKKQTVDQQGWYVVIDDKRHHASGCTARGVWEGFEMYLQLMDPNIKISNFAFERIATWSK
jgi:hypothetical protein